MIMPASSSPRLLFFGTRSLFSYTVLSQLIAGGQLPLAVIVPATAPGAPPIEPLAPPRITPAASSLIELSLLNPYLETNVVGLAWGHNVPAFALRQATHPQTLDTIGHFQPDLICVACFPWRLPEPLLALPHWGGWNVHPSLLPAFRGPAPLFWQFRAGLTSGGVTLHWMDSGFDSGDLIAQAAMPLPLGSSGPQADRQAAVLGARLLLAQLPGLLAGATPRQPQAAARADGWPGREDFSLPATWPVERAFHFMRGTAEWEQPYFYEDGGKKVWVAAAVGQRRGEKVPAVVIQSGQTIWLPFADGMLQATAPH